MRLIEEWNIENQLKNPTILILLIIGTVFVTVESIALYNLKRHGTKGILFCFINDHSHPKYPYSKVFIFLGILLITISGFLKIGELQTKNKIQKEFAEALKVEGYIHIKSMQPKEGHAKGDIIRVGNKTFEVNYFIDTPYYKNTIANNGCLKEGIYAEIFYIPSVGKEKEYYKDGKILRIKIEKN